jgi:hypothetical protein
LEEGLPGALFRELRSLLTPCPDVNSAVRAAHRFGARLREEDRSEEAARLYEQIVPRITCPSLADYASINWALALLDVNEVYAAERLLSTVVQRGHARYDADGVALGAYYVAVGVLGTSLEQRGETHTACRLYEEAFQRGMVLAQEHPERTWPGVYTGIAYLWQLRLLARAGQDMTAARTRHEEFLRTVPVNRWTWSQHYLAGQVLQVWRAAQRARRPPDGARPGPVPQEKLPAGTTAAAGDTVDAV